MENNCYACLEPIKGQYIQYKGANYCSHECATHIGAEADLIISPYGCEKCGCSFVPGGRLILSDYDGQYCSEKCFCDSQDIDYEVKEEI